MTTPTTTPLRLTTTAAASAAPAPAPVAPLASATRRSFLGASAASAVAVGTALSGGFSPAAAATTGLPQVTPVWSESIRRSFGIAVQPNAQYTPYGAEDVWPRLVADMNASYIRGKYTNAAWQRPAMDTVIAQCRALGLKWVMTVIPEDWSMTLAQLRAILTDIRDRAADVCIGIEGMNEPNHNRDGSPLRPDWAEATVAYQKVIWDFVKTTPSMSHVAVLSPSLQMGGADPSVDFDALAAAGIVSYIDYAGMHSYPGGAKPDTKVDVRLGYVRDSWSNKPTWVSETGYQNAMAAPLSGPRPVPNDVAATYGPRSLLEYFSRGCNSARYELLGEPDPTNSEPESAFGLVDCPSNDPATWTVKPEYYVMRDFLAGLRDTPASGATYAPSPVPLQVTAPSTVKWLLTAKADGSTTLYAYLNASIWDVVKRVYLTPAPVSITVTDRAGARTIKVGASVTAIPIR
jgi:hypothetical protein